ncbi:MAG: hypothetical protein KA770_08915 [Shewanella sp.]|nr:hypothetical protein [Shewanella sp.]
MLQTDNKVILLWGNSLLAERAARGLVRIGIITEVTVGGMDATVEPSRKLILKTIGGVSLEQYCQSTLHML